MWNEKHDLERVAEQLDNVHDYGDYLAALCPFHDDTSPSLLVYPDRYRCQACGKNGKTSDLLRLDLSSIGIISTTPDFRNPFTKWTKNKSLAETLKLGWNNLCSNPSIYLQDRGISSSYQKSLGIGYLDDWYTFPIRNSENKIVGATARRGQTNNHPAKYINPYGQDSNLLYFPDWKKINKNYLIVTFGILDAVSLTILGLPACSTTTGKQLHPSTLDEFRHKIFVIPDHGEAQDGYKLVNKLGWRGKVLYHNLYPMDAKDVNDLFIYHRTHLEMFLQEKIEHD